MSETNKSTELKSKSKESTPRAEKDQPKRKAKFEDSEEDEEDQFDEDDEESEGEDTNPRKKKKGEPLPAGMEFLDREAGEGDSESSDEEFEEGFGVDKDVPERQTRPGLMPQLPPKKFGSDLIRELEERFTGKDEDIEEDIDEEDYGAEMEMERMQGIKQQSNYPTVNDPKLFMVLCKQGKEKEAVFNILQKAFDVEKLGKPLLITSALSIETLKGRIYIEAFKEVHVKDAIRGVGVLTEYKLKMVPIKEMTDILNFERKGIVLQKDDWVRCRRGIYKGDLAQVVEVDESKSIAVIKMIPRLEAGSKKKKLFNESEYTGLVVKKKDPRTGEYFSIHAGNRYKDGYIYKNQKFITLDIKGVSPTLDEITQFHQGVANDDAIPQNLGAKKKQLFKKGDEVLVIDGLLKNLMGTVFEVKDDIITVLPRHESLKDPLLIDASELQKYFEIGEYCRVVSGKFEGSTGPIVKLEKDMVVIYNEILGQEIEVFTRDIRKMSEMTSSVDVTLGDYALHDMVRIDGLTAGVIVKMEKDGFKVLDNNSNVQSITIQEMGRKITTRASFYKTMDKANTFVGVGETVRVVEGPFTKREGVIKHVFKIFLFLHSREVLENSGMFVVRAKSCELIGDNKQSYSNNDKGVKPGPKSTFQLKYKKYRHEDTDKHCRVTSGAYKGYLGIVKDANDTSASILLQSTFKNITVPIVDGIKGYELVRGKEDSRPRGQSQPFYLPTTPWEQSHARTPLRESAQTPSHDGSRTPNPYSDAPETPRTVMVGKDPWDPKHTTTTPRWDDKPITPSVRTPYSPFPQNNPITPGTRQTPMYQTPFGRNVPITPGNQYEQPITPGNQGYRMNTPNEGGTFPRTPGSTYPTPHGVSPFQRPPQQYIEESVLDAGVEIDVSDGQYAGMRGSIQKVSGSKSTVLLTQNNDEKVVEVLTAHLKATVPKKGDLVKVVRGKEKGKSGTLTSVLIEEGDVVVKNVENPKDILYLKLNELVKIVK